MTRKVIVFHAYYGCDTGCCGHVVTVVDPGETERCFVFEHPYGRDPREFAEELVARECGDDHVRDLDWEHCIIAED